MTRIGVQAMMLKQEFAAAGPYDTIRDVTALGYRVVEISQIPMTPENVNELRRARDELGVEFAAISAQLSGGPGAMNDALDERFDKIVADAHTLDVSMLRIPVIPIEAMRTVETIRLLGDALNEMTHRLGQEGLVLAYHNHHMDFAKYDRMQLLDILADRAPDLKLEIDVHWVQRAGLDPVTTLKKYAERVVLVHLKDYRIARIPESRFDAFASGDGVTFMSGFGEIVQFAEVGEGNLDFAGIIETSQLIGVQYLLVEQDDRYGRSAIDCLTTSRDNLFALGYADLF